MNILILFLTCLILISASSSLTLEEDLRHEDHEHDKHEDLHEEHEDRHEDSIKEEPEKEHEHERKEEPSLNERVILEQKRQIEESEKGMRETQKLMLEPVEGRFGVYKTESGLLVRLMEAMDLDKPLFKAIEYRKSEYPESLRMDKESPESKPISSLPLYPYVQQPIVRKQKLRSSLPSVPRPSKRGRTFWPFTSWWGGYNEPPPYYYDDPYYYYY